MIYSGKAKQGARSQCMSCGLGGTKVRIYEASKQRSTTGKTHKNDRGSNVTQSEKVVVGLEVGTQGRGTGHGWKQEG